MKPLLISNVDETTARYAVMEGLYFEIRHPDLHYNITFEPKHSAYVLTCSITCVGQPHWKDIIYQIVLREDEIVFHIQYSNWGLQGKYDQYRAFDYNNPQSITDLVAAAKDSNRS